jgi:hypothetical protein
MRSFFGLIVNLLLFIVLCAVVVAAGLALMGRTDLLTVDRLQELIATGQLKDYEFSGQTPFRTGLFLGSLIAGFLIGTVPLIVGALKNKLGMGFLGLLVCIASALVGGLIIGVPVMGVFIYWISRDDKDDGIQEPETSLSQVRK